MINYKYYDLFDKSSVDKQLKIVCQDGTILTNKNFSSTSSDFSLSESLCSDSKLSFGKCESSCLKIKIANTVKSLKGQTLQVTETLGNKNDIPFKFGTYIVDEDTLTSDKKYRNITAYDRLYSVSSINVSDWYNNLFPSKQVPLIRYENVTKEWTYTGTDGKEITEYYDELEPITYYQTEYGSITLKAFRDSFFKYIGLTQQSTTLVNDNMKVSKSVDDIDLTAKDVLEAICEINGVFGKMSREDVFIYVELKYPSLGLFPSKTLYPNKSLFPTKPVNADTRRLKVGEYKTLQVGDTNFEQITKLQIRQSEDDIGYIAGDDTGVTYIIQGNFLTYSAGTDELKTIANNVLSKISKVIFNPINITLQGNPCVETGDTIRIIDTNNKVYMSYVLQRTLTGIQMLMDSIISEGDQSLAEVNGIQHDIIKLQGKTNELSRLIEGTSSTLNDYAKGLKSEISQKTDSLKLSVSKSFSVTNNNIAEVSKGLSSTNQTVNILSNDLTNTNKTLSETNENVTNISNGLSDTNKTVKKVQADLELKIDKDDNGQIISMINASADVINLTGNRLTLGSDNCTITKDGTITARNALLSGSFECGDYTSKQGQFFYASNTGDCGAQSLKLYTSLGIGTESGEDRYFAEMTSSADEFLAYFGLASSNYMRMRIDASTSTIEGYDGERNTAWLAMYGDMWNEKSKGKDTAYMSNNLAIQGKFQVNGNSYFNASQVILQSVWWGTGHPAMIMGHELTFQWYNSNIYVYIDKTQIGYLNITRT
nr:MAG TPA: hypothetical protein [Caudoviricetes sp.]